MARLFKYGAAAALLTVNRDGIAALRFVGPITPSVLEGVWRDLSAYTERRHVLAVVMDTQKAAIALSPEDLMARPRELLPAMRQMPAAVACSPEQYPLLGAHVEALAGLGMVRRAFTAFPLALAWATQKGLALERVPPERPYFQETI